jgi:hypothetical protein
LSQATPAFNRGALMIAAGAVGCKNASRRDLDIDVGSPLKMKRPLMPRVLKGHRDTYRIREDDWQAAFDTLSQVWQTRLRDFSREALIEFGKEWETLAGDVQRALCDDPRGAHTR